MATLLQVRTPRARINMNWRVSTQDYRGWRTKDFKEPHPEVTFEDHPTRGAAELAKTAAIAAGLTACITPTPHPKRKGRPKIFDAGKFNREWKMHR